MMKKRMFSTSALILMSNLFIANTSALEIDGYLIKLKDDKQASIDFFEDKIQNDASLKYQSVDLPEGNFYHFKSNDKKSAQALKNHPSIEYIIPNEIITVEPDFSASEEVPESSFSDDSEFKYQWGLHNNGRNNWVHGKAGTDVSAQAAWKLSRGSRDIVIAIVDSGIDLTHPDLQENIYINRLELNGIKGVDDDGNGYIDDISGYDFANKDGNPQDGLGHGTHCAGIIGAAHNKQGVAGIMPHVRIMPLKFIKDAGKGSTLDALRAINYAIDNGANIISNSWGGGSFNPAMEAAIKRAKNLGILFLASAGNKKKNNDKLPKYPASYKVDNVIVVAAMNGKAAMAKFSNYGVKTVHVSAPGTSIISTWPKKVAPFKSYMWKSGTSMATPLVAGVLGLLLSEHPNMSYLEAKERLMATVVKSRRQRKKTITGGYVDAYRLLKDIRD